MVRIVGLAINMMLVFSHLIGVRQALRQTLCSGADINEKHIVNSFPYETRLSHFRDAEVAR